MLAAEKQKITAESRRRSAGKALFFAFAALLSLYFFANCPETNSAGKNAAKTPAAVAVPAPQQAAGTPQPPVQTAAAAPQVENNDDLEVKISIDRPKIISGQQLTVTFTKPLAPKKGERYWIAVIPEDEPDGAYSPWRFLDEGMTEAQLEYPHMTCKCRVTLFARHPSEKLKAIDSKPIQIVKDAPEDDEDVSFYLVSPHTYAGYKLKMIFDRKIYPRRKGEQYRMTISKDGSSEDDYDTHRYLPSGLTSWVHFVPDTPAKYEVRLHARWPHPPYNVIYRRRMFVVRPYSTDDTSGFGSPEFFRLPKAVVSTLEKPRVTFPGPLESDYRIAVMPMDSEGETAENAVKAAKGDTEAVLVNPGEPGMYEIVMFAGDSTRRQDLKYEEPLLIVPPPPSEWTYLGDDAKAVDLRVTFEMEQEAITVGDKPVIKFNKTLTPRYGEKYWVAFAPEEYPDMIYMSRQFLDPGISEVKLDLPRLAGKYEVRLYGRYPTDPYHVLCRKTVNVAPAAGSNGETLQIENLDLEVSFQVEKSSVAPGDSVKLMFKSVLMPRPGERYWLTIAPAGSPEDRADNIYYIGEGVTDIALPAPKKPGNYEVRLYGRYPTQEHMLIQKVELKVE